MRTCGSQSISDRADAIDLINLIDLIHQIAIELNDPNDLHKLTNGPIT